LKKDELNRVCSELNIQFSSSIKVDELISLIENSDSYKDKNDIVLNIILEISEEKRKKSEQAENERYSTEQQLEIKKLSYLRIEKDIELFKLKSAY
ncbi:hypothetical protein NPIL_283471, partial [Nephila pilipes]